MANRRNFTSQVPEFSAEEITAAIRKHKGLLSYATKELGIDVRTLKSRIKRYPSCIAALEEARQEQGDICEHQIFAAIERGESWAIRLYATTQMKDRGYAEKTVVEQPAPKKAQQPKSLSIDYDEYNAAYKQAMEVVQRAGSDHTA